jgi:hypothetical protein
MLSARFDFEAKGPNGTGLVRIEAKGTFNNVSRNAHRASIQKKIVAQGNARNYSRNVGIMAVLWTEDKQGGFDMELSDPESEPRDHFEEPVREVIRFYAFRFDESVDNEEGVKSLLAIADDPALFDKEEPESLLALGSADGLSRHFWTSTGRLAPKTPKAALLGSALGTTQASNTALIFLSCVGQKHYVFRRGERHLPAPSFALVRALRRARRNCTRRADTIWSGGGRCVSMVPRSRAFRHRLVCTRGSCRCWMRHRALYLEHGGKHRVEKGDLSG